MDFDLFDIIKSILIENDIKIIDFDLVPITFKTHGPCHWLRTENKQYYISASMIYIGELKNTLHWGWTKIDLANPSAIDQLITILQE